MSLTSLLREPCIQSLGKRSVPYIAGRGGGAGGTVSPSRKTFCSSNIAFDFAGLFPVAK